MNIVFNLNIKEAVTQEQARLLHRNFIPALCMDLLAISTVTGMFWSVAPHIPMMIWCISFIMFHSSSFYRLRTRPHFETHYAAASKFLKQQTIDYTINSTLWGIMILVVFPHVPLAYQFALLFVVPLWTMAGALAAIAHLNSAIAGVLPLSLCAVISASTQNDSLFHFTAIALALFLLGILFFSKQLNRMFVESLELRFNNNQLLLNLSEQKDIAEKANVAKSRFFAAASHDLRQPLHALNLYLGSMSSSQLPEWARATIKNAEECTYSMDIMFKALLEMSQLEASVIKPDVRCFPIQEIFERLKIQFGPDAKSRNFSLRFVKSSIWIKSDPQLIERILSNFISNALRYANKGKVLLGCRRKNGQVMILVHDTGDGIPKDQLNNIFDDFFQLEKHRTTSGQGLGLGLSIVRKLTLLLNIPIHVVSTLGYGSTFGILLPIIDKNHQYCDETLSVSSPQPVMLSGKSLLAIVIDDEIQVLNASKQLLEQWQFEVVTATNLAEAKAAITRQSQDIAVIICDYQLHGSVSGIDVINELREEINMDTPAIIITGNTTSELTEKIKAHEFEVLYKPLSSQEFKDAVFQAIRTSLHS